MEQYKIEFVCTANKGRSPVAELIGNNYLQKKGLQDYLAISSGSHVDSIKGGSMPLPLMISLIEKGRSRDYIIVMKLKILMMP